jgi:pre-rRNA-processing protein TSR1
MERFLHAGRQTMMSVYAPICYPPLPVLAFHRGADGSLHLAASGVFPPSDFPRLHQLPH